VSESGFFDSKFCPSILDLAQNSGCASKKIGHGPRRSLSSGRSSRSASDGGEAAAEDRPAAHATRDRTATMSTTATRWWRQRRRWCEAEAEKEAAATATVARGSSAQQQ